MNKLTNKKWGYEVLKGAIALILAILIFMSPANALVAIATYIGIIAIVAGIIIIVMSLIRKSELWQIWLAEGFINALIGLLIVLYPEISASLLILIIGFWITIFGIIQLVTYFRFSRSLTSGNLTLASAVISVLVGLLLLFNPFEGAVLATIIMAVYATIFAITRFYLAWKIYKFEEQ